jgi:hypothetical protein
VLHSPRSLRPSALILALALLSACGGPAPVTQNRDPVPTTAPAAPAATEPPAIAVEPAPVEEEEPAPVEEEEPIAAAELEQPVKSDEEEFFEDEGFGEGGIDTSGEYVADLGFRPEFDGFSFPNYGGESGATNLTSNDVWRMFGDVACASIEGEGDGAECTLTPPGQQWMEEINEAMNGGHCEGMAVLSNMFYTGVIDVNAYGAPSVPELSIEENEPLQREIAYWWATQSTMPAREGIVRQTPSGIVNTLLTAFAAGPEGSEQYAVGFYQRDGSGGHAVTPYAVEDRGEGIYWIMVYDNNYPGAARAIEVDTNNDTWRYTGSTNPEESEAEYEGDAETFTLELAAIAPRLDEQICPFCDEPAEARVGGLAQADGPSYNEIWFDGDADLLITDIEGRSVGFRDGEFVNEIPGATSNANKFGVSIWNNDSEPVYYIPTDVDFTIAIDGSRLEEPSMSAVTMIGPGYMLEIDEILLEPGQVDTLDVAPDGSLLAYRTETGESPIMYVGIETDASDYYFAVQGYELAAGEALNLSLDTDEGWLAIDSIDNADSGSYAFAVVKYDEQGEQVFGAEDVVLDPDDVIYIDYLLWPGNGEPMELDVDRGGDGEVDETLTIEDMTDMLEE